MHRIQVYCDVIGFTYIKKTHQWKFTYFTLFAKKLEIARFFPKRELGTNVSSRGTISKKCGELSQCEFLLLD